MIREWVRTYGLFVGGVSMFVGGGLATIYGLLFFYVTAPGGPEPNRVVGPLNDLVLAVVDNELFVPLALVGLGVFFADVYRNGLPGFDDRTYWERKKDLRRRKARENDAWDPPPEDQDERTVYDELVEQVEAASSWKFEVCYTEPDDTVVTYRTSPPEGTQVDGI